MDDVLRRRRKISASTWSLARAGLDGVIPFRMERVTLDIEGRHFGVGDFDALFVGAGIELTADRETRLGRGRRDQLDDGRPAREGPTAPVLRDVTEQSVFDLVPLGCARRIVANDDDPKSGS